MKHIIIALVILLSAASANATLVDNGDGTITDTDRNMMWLKDANYAMTSGYTAPAWNPYGWMNWQQATYWARQLDFAGYTDWKLPSPLNSDGSGPCDRLNCTDSDMGHMYYTELGNKAGPEPGGGLLNTGPFINLVPHSYWTDTFNLATGYTVWGMSWLNGDQGQIHQNSSQNVYSWAVRDCGGPCPTAPIVPEPVSSILFITGGGVLAARRYFRRGK